MKTRQSVKAVTFFALGLIALSTILFITGIQKRGQEERFVEFLNRESEKHEFLGSPDFKPNYTESWLYILLGGILPFSCGVTMLIFSNRANKKVTNVEYKEQQERNSNNAKIEQAHRKHEIELNEWKQNIYPKLLSKYEVPINTQTVMEKVNPSTWIKKYVFIVNNSLCFFPCLEEYHEDKTLNGYELSSDLERFFFCNQIPLEVVEFFTSSGELYRENKITGGGGGGTDIGGAIIGGIIAGEAGAIIGSRMESNEIESKLITHDTRETILNYFVNGNRKTMTYKHENYQIFDDLIPNKSFNIVSEIKKHELVQQNINVDNKVITEQIKELAKLKDDGILTEDEFTEKKIELLAKL